MRCPTACALVAAACLLLSSGVSAAVASAPSTGLESLNGFIRVSGTSFVDDNCDQFVFSGYNTWQPVEQASGMLGGLPALRQQLDAAVTNNLTVIRAFAFVVQEGYNMQLSDGTYNETLLVAMDNFVAEASSRGLKLIMALANNWNYNSNMSDTKTWYADQAGLANPDDFWTDAEAIQMYKDHVRFIMTRKNTVSGVTYGNDPTMFSWNLMNEGRCESAACTPAAYQSWIASVAPYVKSLTSSLVTVGQEGYFQASNCQSNYANPVDNADGWPLATGQDFLPNHYLKDIDYTSIHMWSDNWGRTDVPFAQGWLESHIQDSKLIGKPLVIEEFGKASGPFTTSGNTYGENTTVADQSAYYKLVYSIAETSIDNGDVLKGVAFWRWDAIDTGSSLSALDSALSLNSTSTAFNEVVVPFSARVKDLALGKKPVGGCSNAATSQAVGAPVASTAVTNAGRRLKAAAAPGPGMGYDAINAKVTNCTAFQVYAMQSKK